MWVPGLKFLPSGRGESTTGDLTLGPTVGIRSVRTGSETLAYQPYLHLLLLFLLFSHVLFSFVHSYFWLNTRYLLWVTEGSFWVLAGQSFSRVFIFVFVPSQPNQLGTEVYEAHCQFPLVFQGSSWEARGFAMETFWRALNSKFCVLRVWVGWKVFSICYSLSLQISRELFFLGFGLCSSHSCRGSPGLTNSCFPVRAWLVCLSSLMAWILLVPGTEPGV